ncbi:hypothetical protein ACJX0J_018020, partial [Zea mays]
NKIDKSKLEIILFLQEILREKLDRAIEFYACTQSYFYGISKNMATTRHIINSYTNCNLALKCMCDVCALTEMNECEMSVRTHFEACLVFWSASQEAKWLQSYKNDFIWDGAAEFNYSRGATHTCIFASHGKGHVVITNPLITVSIQLETPIVNRLDGNNGTSLNPPAECAHPLNKRFHYSKTDKLGLFPRTKLFSPVGLFDLQITDDESDHNGRGRNTAAAISAAVDQMYNDMNIFNVESEAGGFFLGNQLEVGNVVRNDVGENWLQVQNAHARFPCSNVLLRYYNLCGMGRSQWKDLVAVRFSKTTTVNWESFGLSIEPNGHCDNFFIAGNILKIFILGFEDLRKSFLGANSALKLHRSNKLYFPVCHANHWFLFIVDLKNKRFVFMDSYFDEEDPFNIRVFKVLWLLYSDSNIDVSSFKILYPAVPKQENTHDCGIFTLQYMEYWDISVDMMLKFRTEDIPQIRITLANDLYFSEKNTEDKSLVRNMFLQ